MKKLLLVPFSFLIMVVAVAQTGKTQSILVNVTTLGTGGVRLNWPQVTYTGQYQIYKRQSLKIEDFGVSPFAVVAGNSNGFTDSTVKAGEAFEYQFAKVNGATTDAIGYVYAGNKLKEQTQFGGIILLIDSTYQIPVASQILRLQQDLSSEGWLVKTIYAGRNQTPPTVKTYIQTAFNNFKGQAKTLFIIGHVTVPYSGYFSGSGDAVPPDGHVEGSGNHTGAWPADVYYADMKNNWTDNSVNCTTGIQPRMYNIPGDGKFDQTKIPDTLDLEVGRVDLFNMPTFKKSDTALIQNYLDRDHNWRVGNWQPIERSLLDDNFTTLNLSSTGYNNFSALVRADSNFTNRDYIPSQKKGSYLWSYGCGAGSFTTCSGIGATADFANDSFSNVFTMLAGSFFGDWDNQNNFLRAPVAQSSLASFWGGLPKWYVHHMGLGMNIGYGARLTQNNQGFYFDGGFNQSGHSVHIALMGDPTLKMRNIGAVPQVTAVSNARKVYLNWKSVAGNIDGYCIYKVDSQTNQYVRVNTNIITATFYVDDKNYYTGNYTYAARAIRLETTASGSYYNVGVSAYAKIYHINAVGETAKESININVFPNPSSNIFHLTTEVSFHTEGDVVVYDIRGKEIWSMHLNSKDNHQVFDIDLSTYPRGVYILNIKTNEASLSRKLMLMQ